MWENGRKDADLKRALTKLLVGKPKHWAMILPYVQFHLNNQINTRNDVTPYELMFGIKPHTSFMPDTVDFDRSTQLALLKDLREALAEASSCDIPASSKPCPFRPGIYVQERVARPSILRPKWKKPTLVTEVDEEK